MIRGVTALADACLEPSPRDLSAPPRARHRHGDEAIDIPGGQSRLASVDGLLYLDRGALRRADGLP
ncbi:hypothetical protein [Chondromyces crocatus]|uniref:Uncharacterized protein n=1 Tax=Chondromyces crocatus TaxID=52 RepID=A0A0K1EBF2_CHOCO|nr:hypothetical protein [Chondromyces crocatus]AKT38211.1 uncharacterized protein CMC5_023540 [Chondromyces crocatus]